jgi:hypothetical protein
MLWKTHSRVVITAESSSFEGALAEANERERTHEFCVLVGNVLWSYSDAWAYVKGDPPTVRLWDPYFCLTAIEMLFFCCFV